MSEGPYRVEKFKGGWHYIIAPGGDELDNAYSTGEQASVVCNLLNSAFAAGLEQNAKYKAAWEEMLAVNDMVETGSMDERAVSIAKGFRDVLNNIARKHGIKEGE